MGRCALLLALGLLASPAAWPQGFYRPAPRPAGLKWWTLDSPRYRFIYHAGLEAEARFLMRLLEAQHDSTWALLGRPRLERIPVILNGYSDQGNGFVATFPLRMELITSPFLGKTLPPGHDSWLHLLAKHEQLHAIHLQQATLPGLGGLVRLLTPDLNVLLNLSTPDGFSEGMAVRVETGQAPTEGRGRYSFFSMQYRAFMDHDPPWTLAQMVRRGSTYTPVDRAYQGGYLLADYVLRHHGARAWVRTIRLYNALPFLGFGPALWAGTGRWPEALYRDLVREVRAWSDSLRRRSGPLQEPRLLASEPHTSYRNPVFYDDSTLIVYRGSVNDRPGLFRLNRRTGRLQRLFTFRPTEDFLFSLSPDGSLLWASAYVPDPMGADRVRSELFALDLKRGLLRRLSWNARASAPVPAPEGRLWYLEGRGPYNRWMELDLQTGQRRPRSPQRAWLFKRLVPDPEGRQVAVVLHQEGRQDLYWAPVPRGEELAQLERLVGFPQGAVYDVAWAPDGRALYFSADPEGQLELYRLWLADRRLERLTRSAYGAMEPAVSPDGRWLVYVHYRRGRFELVEVPIDSLQAEPIAPDPLALTPRSDDPHAYAGATADDGASEAPPEPPARPYRAWAYWLRPRLLLPALVRDVNLGLTGLLRLEGADPLRQGAYALDLRYVRGRPWGEFWMGLAWPYPYPQLQLSSLPVVTTREVQQEERFRLGFLAPRVGLETVYSSQVTFAPYLAGRRVRSLERAEPWRSYLTAGLGVEARYRVHALARDITPNAGWALSLLGEADLAGTRTGRWASVEIRRFLSVWMRRHHTAQLYVRALLQEGRFFWSAAPYIPLGYRTDYVRGARHLYKVGLRYYVPLVYVDNGLLTVPIYVDRVFLYGLLEHGGRLWPADLGRSWREGRTSLGLYAALRATLWVIPVEVRLGYLYRLYDKTGRWEGGYPIWSAPW
ncbi:MAG: hypothetical protein RML47_01880 [Bacteroidota bacterium]|nr:hypothetical protein [Rhodothermia bacterium]MDW8284834.1 hypothetical protein [Bacteroidota bacterium]